VTPARRRCLQALFVVPWFGLAQARTLNDLLGAISVPQAEQALRESLATGARKAIARLGQGNGFFGDPKLKIGLPKNFARAEKFLRGIGQGRKVDELVLAMNRAAESAAPKTLDLIIDSIAGMSVQDAKAILTGDDDAATMYFRKTTESHLSETLLPVVKSVTEKSDLARAYNNLAATLAGFGIRSDRETVEAYVNRKALDGIYQRIGEEERSMRANPSQYAGSVLGEVLGLLK
jgi:ribosomal protein L22